jgi:alanine racemase
VTFALEVDAARWRAALDRRLADEPRMIPVIKGNGYGFGNGRLAAEAARLGVDTVAVGSAHEVAQVRAGDGRTGFDGDVLILSPWHPAYPGSDRATDITGDERIIRTLSHPEAVLELAQRDPGARVVVEALTSMHRHGIAANDLPLLLRPLESLTVEAFALHLPLDRAGNDDSPAEVDRWAGLLADAGLHPRSLWVSHLSAKELGQVRAFLPGADLRPRIGTRLWLGEPSTYAVRSTVLDVHPVRRGERVGYRQRKAPRDGYVLVVAGGTAHGVGLEAPPSSQSLTGRGRTVAKGGLEAAGVSTSPFRLGGKRLRFAEPPHMQVSMLWWSGEGITPRPGDRVDARVRMTTSHFDDVIGLATP